MKKVKIIIIAFIGAMFFLILNASAQNKTAKELPQKDTSAVWHQMKVTLGLNDQQLRFVEDVLSRYRNRIDSIRNDTKMNMQQKEQLLLMYNVEKQQRVASLLTLEQNNRLKEWLQKRASGRFAKTKIDGSEKYPQPVKGGVLRSTLPTKP